jgi:preprotein translocase subunit SecA
MNEEIREETAMQILTFVIKKAEDTERKQVATITATSSSSDGTDKKRPVRNTEKKIGPNDPCPCGSGKKYKKCCGSVNKEQ